MNSLEKLKQRLQGMNEYHLEERAQRLDEIGGPGVGGLEPRYCPHFVTRAETKKELKLMALQDSISRLWSEAAMCYVDGHFRACIVLFAVLLEMTLKSEFERRDIEYSKRLTLGRCIDKCRELQILPKSKNDAITKAAIQVNNYRNDVAHANIERSRPKSLLDVKGPEHEVKLAKDPSRYIKDGAITGNGETISFGRGGLSIIYWYKTAAKNTLDYTKKILEFLYADNRRGIV